MSAKSNSTGLMTPEEVDWLCQIGGFSSRSEPEQDRTFLIAKCAGCGYSLNRPTLKEGYLASAACCPTCGRLFYSTCRSSAVQKLDAGESVCVLPTAAASHDDFAAKAALKAIMGDAYLGDERRDSARQHVTAPVTVVPLEAQESRSTAARTMTIVEVSKSGLGMLGDDGFFPFFVVDFSVAGPVGVQVAVEVVSYHTANGRARFGCRFLHTPGTALPIEVVDEHHRVT